MKWQRGEKKLAAICTLALAIPLGVAAFIGHINVTPIIAATAPVKAPNPNGYDLYVAASNLIRPANPPVDANLDTKNITDPKIRAQRYSLQRKDAWLAQNKVGFALFKQAQKVDSLAPSGRNNGKELRQMARCKIIESNAHWQRGNADATLQSGLDVAQLGYDIQRGGVLIDFLVGAAIGQLATRSTGDVAEVVSAQTAKNGARRLENLLNTRRTLDAALAEDHALVRQDWLRLFQNPAWRADFVRPYEELIANWGGDPLTYQERWLIQITSKRQIIADLDTVYQRAQIKARAPYTKPEKGELVTGNPFIDKTKGHLAHHPFNKARALTADRILMLRLALRAHQLEHGAPPLTLQSLVPAYIKTVPIDPFGTGAPLRYKTDGKNYTLWSIGPDGCDDGGKPISWRKKAPVRYAGEREKLPFMNDDSIGDYVAGKNH